MRRTVYTSCSGAQTSCVPRGGQRSPRGGQRSPPRDARTAAAFLATRPGGVLIYLPVAGSTSSATLLISCAALSS
ncbi:hypothetical protein PLICRDRAFT_234509 [Plicaturopsis crispa FD-325 SS-3]|nr:hypothetical protein PLICRDRAFT_234509 [Plicaturopsis crispa FD-325 SS-3]